MCDLPTLASITHGFFVFCACNISCPYDGQLSVPDSGEKTYPVDDWVSCFASVVMGIRWGLEQLYEVA